MARTADLHDLLQDLSELMDRRLVLTDDRLRVVGYSIHETETDRDRLSTVLARSDSWPRPSGSGEVVLDLGGHGRLRMIPLRDNRQRVGFLLVACRQGETDFLSTDREILAEHLPTLGILLSLRTLYAERDRHRTSGLLADLLGEDEQSRQSAAQALLREELLGSSRHYSAVAVGCDTRSLGAVADPDSAVELAVETALDFVGRTSTASVIGTLLGDGTGVLVFPRPVVRERLERVLDRPELATVRAGIGPLVGDLSGVVESFRRAKAALAVNHLSRSTPKVSVWDDLGTDRLLIGLPLAELGPDNLPAPIGPILAAELGPELIGTLVAYVDHGGDVAATTRLLHIHRSTLYHRLGRIRDVSGIDVTDPMLRRELTIGMRIAQLAELI